VVNFLEPKFKIKTLQKFFKIFLVISKHKDRIEALFAKEKERCNESINQQSKRISLLQIENVRLNDLMENISQQKVCFFFTFIFWPDLIVTYTSL